MRDRQLQRRDVRAAYRSLVEDVTAGRFLRAELTRRMHREAERLMIRLGERAALRAADGLHLVLATFTGARTLITYDRRMAAAGHVIGRFEVIG
jgi:predicted nucleic acid-binding protein